MADQLDINLLVEQIKELVPTFKKLAGTQTTGGTDRDTNRLIAALGRLAATMDKVQRNEDQYLKDFAKSVDAGATAIESAAKKIKQAADEEASARDRAAEEQRRASLSAVKRQQEDAEKLLREREKTAREEHNYARDLAEARRSATRSQGTFGRKIDEMAERYAAGGGDMVKFYERINRAGEVLRSLQPLGKGIMDMGKALYEGKQGASVNNSALEGLGETADKLGGQFGPLGMIVGKLIKMFTFLAVEANKMGDRLYKSYQDLSRVGVTAEDGMMGLAQSAQRLGLGLDDTGIENFGRLMKEAATGLALMSGSAAKGRRDFTDFASEVVRGSAGRELMNLGMSVEQINEGLADYINLQSRVGQTQGKTTAQLAAGANAYLREMDLLTKLTGQTRKEMEDRIKRARAIEQFRAKTEQMRRSGDARQIKAAFEAEKAFSALAGAGAEDAAQGFAENFSGFISTDAGARFGQLTGFQMDMAEQFISGQLDAVKAFGGVSRAANEAVAGLGGELGLVGASSALYGNFSQLADLAQYAGHNFEDAADIQRAIQERQAKGPGGVAAQTDMRRAQMDTRDAMQNFILDGVQPATTAMSSFAQVVSKVTGLLGGPAPKMGAGSTTGLGQAGGAGGAYGRGGTGSMGGSLASTAAGAAAGAVVGSAVPVVGTAIGGIIGGALGYMGYQAAGGSPMAAGAQPGTQQKMLDFIGRIESGGNYNVLVGGKTKSDPPLTEMTVGQVLDFQAGMRQQGHESTAVGKYQILRGTLTDIMSKAGVGLNDRFDSATQDKLAVALMKRRGLDQFQRGVITPNQYADNLAQEWASLPNASGQSAYTGTGSNKSLVSRDEFMRAITAQTGGVFSGPKSGYAATLHGTEAVVPLPDGKTIPVAMPNLDRSMQEQVNMMGAQLIALEELVRYMRDNNAINTKILQAANN